MFYEDLYKILGKLFYNVAATDGRVQHAEKEKLHQLIQTNWKPLESSADEFDTDLANQIEFSFDYEETESVNPKGLEDF